MAPHSPTGTHMHGVAEVDPSTRVQRSYSPQECPPPCPACGGLECLCRPRFFPGQLLTDEDLNRLDQYIVEKNRLHNRYLHGHGIACGLEVACHPCDPKSVIVKPGYALSPCGDDIIVCKDSPVNICDLINRCRPVTQVPCDPMHPGSTDTCPEGPEDWVLAICYDEKPSRGVAALRADVSTSCCSQCACGGLGSCCCGGQSQNRNGHSKTVSATTQHKKRLAQCEPTLTCETYKFMVYRAKADVPERPSGLHVSRAFRANALRFVEKLPAAPQDTPSMLEVENNSRAFQRAAWDFVSETQCASGEIGAIRQAILDIPIPLAKNFNKNRPKFDEASHQFIAKVNVSVAKYLSLLLCNILKPSCPAPVERNCTPLARMKVHKPDCHVMSICGASVREYVLSALLERLYAVLRPRLTDLLGELCCKPEWQRPPRPPVIGKVDVAMRARAISALREEAAVGEEGPKPMNLSTHLENAFARVDEPADIERIVLALMGAMDEQGKPFAAPEEVADPAIYLLANQVLRPALKAALPSSWDTALEMVSRIGAHELGTVATATQPAGLRREMTALKSALDKKIASQAARIKALEERINR